MKKFLSMAIPIVGALAVGIYLKNKCAAPGEEHLCECPRCGSMHDKGANCCHRHFHHGHCCAGRHDQGSLQQVKDRLEQKLEEIKERLNKLM